MWREDEEEWQAKRHYTDHLHPRHALPYMTAGHPFTYTPYCETPTSVILYLLLYNLGFAI